MIKWGEKELIIKKFLDETEKELTKSTLFPEEE